MTFRLRTVLFGLACAGTASVGCSGPAATTTAAFPETCAEAKDVASDAGETAVNGTYTLYVNGDESMPWDAYCYNMSRAEPSAYLTVNEDKNYSQASDGANVAETQFRRIRIDEANLELWPLDTTFADTNDDDDVLSAPSGGATALGVDDLPLGFAWWSGDEGDGGAATSKMDLDGTAFVMSEDVDDDGYFDIDLGDDTDDEEASFDTSSDLKSFELVAVDSVDDGGDTTITDSEVTVAVDFENMTEGDSTDDLDVDAVIIPLEYSGE